MTMNDLTPTATIKQCDDRDASFMVRASYPHAGTDRVNGMGWVVKKLSVAKRLVTAIEAGAVLTSPTIETDVNCNTYVSASSQVLGRKMNADLKRLGY